MFQHCGGHFSLNHYNHVKTWPPKPGRQGPRLVFASTGAKVRILRALFKLAPLIGYPRGQSMTGSFLSALLPRQLPDHRHSLVQRRDLRLGHPEKPDLRACGSRGGCAAADPCNPGRVILPLQKRGAKVSSWCPFLSHPNPPLYVLSPDIAHPRPGRCLYSVALTGSPGVFHQQDKFQSDADAKVE